MISRQIVTLLIAALLLLTLVQSRKTFAQTTTPTPPYPGIVFEPLQSPTPIPTFSSSDLEITVEVPHSDIYNGLATVESGLSSLPANLANPGLPVLPGTQGGELFGYIKWVFSANTASEVFGFFSGVIIHTFARIQLMVFLAGVALIIYLVTYVLKFITWITYKIRAIFP